MAAGAAAAMHWFGGRSRQEEPLQPAPRCYLASAPKAGPHSR